MKSVKDYIAEILGLDRCVTDLSGYRVLIELVIIAALVLLFSLPAIMW